MFPRRTRRAPSDTAPHGTVHDSRPELPMPETVLLWSMRTWLVGHRHDLPAEHYIASAFAELGAPGATGYFQGLMWALSHGAARDIGLHRPCCPRVGEDEQALLDVFALTQDRQGVERLLVLRGLLRPAAAVAAGESVSGLVGEFNRAGLFFTATYAPLRHRALPYGAPRPGDAPHRRPD